MYNMELLFQPCILNMDLSVEIAGYSVYGVKFLYVLNNARNAELLKFIESDPRKDLQIYTVV